MTIACFFDRPGEDTGLFWIRLHPVHVCAKAKSTQCAYVCIPTIEMPYVIQSVCATDFHPISRYAVGGKASPHGQIELAGLVPTTCGPLGKHV